MNHVETVFRSDSLPDARRATDMLRDGGIEALLRSDWSMNHAVLVPAVSTRSAAQLLAREQLDGELTIAPPRVTRTALGWLFVAVAAAACLWLVARSLE